MIFNGIDNPPSTLPTERYAGILTLSLTPKPVYQTLKSLYNP
jgi:hypothetical protein